MQKGSIGELGQLWKSTRKSSNGLDEQRSDWDLGWISNGAPIYQSCNHKPRPIGSWRKPVCIGRLKIPERGLLKVIEQRKANPTDVLRGAAMLSMPRIDTHPIVLAMFQGATSIQC